jgi:spore coat polysaccharide biosynthesis protein SpsF (cytidylyltransferase family)
MPASTKERIDKHDCQVAAIRELIHEGMRLTVDTRKDIRVLAAMQRATAEAQKSTDASLKALIDSMRGGNRHASGKGERR